MKRTNAALMAETAIAIPAATSRAPRAFRKVIDDPMHRFVPCPHTAHLPAAGRTVRLETNNPKLRDHMIELFACYPTPAHESADFLWRIIVESDSRSVPPWPRRSTFSDEGIRFAQFGQRNFLAVDLDAREAIGSVSEGLFEDTHGFTSPFVDTLFYMTAGALGLVPFLAACLCSGTDALFVLGPPNQGKTTASYLAAQNGLTFLADQSVFLETVNSELRAWGDFVLLAFRPETLRYLPELTTRTLPFSYCDFSFYYMPKEQQGSGQRGHVSPTCCVVLERGASVAPCVDRLSAAEFAERLSNYIAFKDDRRFELQEQKIVRALADLPAYRLAYDSNPANAAPILRTLLSKHSQPSGKAGVR